MKTWLSYTFEHYPEDSVDACWWLPSILCNDESKRLGGYYLNNSPNIKAREIYVESVRAYHLIRRREDIVDWEGIIRIAAPVPSYDTVEKRFNVLVIASDLQELCIGAHVVDKVGGIVCLERNNSELVGLIAAARLVLFPSKVSSSNFLLCAALGSQCRIVSSDAGSAEEYLTRHGIPGCWHVLHNHRQKDYLKACSDLLFGHVSVPDFGESEYVDDAPYE